MTHDTPPRRLANWLVRQAERTLPPSRRDWALGMRRELAYLDNDWQAIRWAGGCLAAGYVERLRAGWGIEMLMLRFMVALLLAFKAFEAFFATALTLAYRTGSLGLAQGLGEATPGDRYQRLIPLMEAVPAWLHALWVVAGVLYLIAIAQLLLKPRVAYMAVLGALSFEIAATVFGRPVIAATGVVVNPNPSVLASVILPYVLPLLLAATLWWDARAVTSRTVGGAA